MEDLRDTGLFDLMDKESDEDEHSLEMHLPYIRHVFAERYVRAPRRPHLVPRGSHSSYNLGFDHGAGRTLNSSPSWWGPSRRARWIGMPRFLQGIGRTPSRFG